MALPNVFTDSHQRNKKMAKQVNEKLRRAINSL
jgi:hypothetical protein